MADIIANRPIINSSNIGFGGNWLTFYYEEDSNVSFG